MATIKKFYTFYESIILENIDLSAYNMEASTNFEKVQAVYNIFLLEYSHEIARQRGDKVAAFREWLMGLPSVITVPFYYHEQISMGYVHGLIAANATEQEEDNFCQSFFQNCAEAFFNLYDNL